VTAVLIAIRLVLFFLIVICLQFLQLWCLLLHNTCVTSPIL